jgi:ATP:ADP antiporter, AAA family
MASPSSTTQAERSALERILGIFAEVRAGEGVTALIMTLNIFLLLASYYVIKPVREALILAMEGGAEYKSYMSGVIAVSLLGAVPAYASFAKKLPRNRLVVGVTLFFAAHLVLFYVASLVPPVRAWLGLVFFLWVGIFNMMVVAQFWAFAADIYSEEQGKRLFAILGIGASVGATAGAFAASKIIKVIGTYQALIVAAAVLGLCAFLTQVVHVRESGRQEVKAQLKVTVTANVDALKKAIAKQSEPKKEGAFSMVFRYRYLILLAAFSLLFTWVNSNGEYILSSVVSQSAKEQATAGVIANDKQAIGDWIGAYYGDFFAYVNLVGFLLQSFVVSRIVKYFGLRTAFLMFPIVALLDSSAILVSALVALPMLRTVRFGKTAENAVDYSINNTSRNMLWLPTTRQMKYQAKQAVDSFFVRMGDAASSLIVYGMAGVLHLSVGYFAGANIALCVVLVVLCLAIMREQEVLKKMRESGEIPDEEPPAAAA